MRSCEGSGWERAFGIMEKKMETIIMEKMENEMETRECIGIMGILG